MKRLIKHENQPAGSRQRALETETNKHHITMVKFGHVLVDLMVRSGLSITPIFIHAAKRRTKVELRKAKTFDVVV